MSSRKSLDVRCVDSSLIATFSKANPPLIWRFDIERNHSFTLAMQGQDNEWELGVTSVKGEFHPVARFPVREDAEEAFEEVSAVLAKGGGHWILGLLKNLGILVLLFILAILATNLIVGSMSHPAANPQMQTQGADPNDAVPHYKLPPESMDAPASKNGVPLSADDVLKPPSP